MRNPPPPAHYNPPPMFGLRTRWPRRVRPYVFVNGALYGPDGKSLAVYPGDLAPGDVLTLDANGASVNGRLVIPIPGVRYVDYSVGFDHFSYPAPLTSGTDAEP